MRSSIVSSFLLSAAVAILSGSQQVHAASDPAGLRVVARNSEGLEKRVSGSPYNIAGAAAAHSEHRRHHKKKNSKRAACSAQSSSSTSSSTVSRKVTAAYSEPESNSNSNSTSSSGSSSNNSSSSTNKTSSNNNTNSKSASSSSSATSSASDASETDVSPIATGSDSDSSSSSGTKASGSVSGFSGTNSGIGSWFRTNLGSDSTNGMSWCETKYQDDWPCFAPSVGTMLSGYSDRQSAAKAYCGREAKVTNTKTGSSATMFICDGFDDKWVRTPGSIDLTVGAFTTLNGGSFDGNKNNVLQVSWELTGNVASQGTFQTGKYDRK